MHEQPAAELVSRTCSEAEPPVGLRVVAALIGGVILAGAFVAMSIATGEAEAG